MTHSDLSRRTVIAAAGGLVAAPAVLRAAESRSEFVVTQTALGQLRGRRLGGVDVYKGVVYGGDVSGLRRFLPAAPAVGWKGVRDALTLGPPSIQPPGGTFGVGEPQPDENCLCLNIWAPATGATRRPVMVYAHGGGFVSGSGGAPGQDGSALARDHDVVVVSTNHRLGLLGYLYLGELGGGTYDRSGNQGLWDLRLALKWIADNITAFGGDPGNVMLFGEGGGGAKTACLYAMPTAEPLFAKAAIQSGPAVRIGTAETAAQTTRLVLKALGLEPSQWAKLQDVPPAALLKAQQAVTSQSLPPVRPLGLADFDPGGLGPILDAELLPHHPFDPSAPATARSKPLITGSRVGVADSIGFATLLTAERKAAQCAAPVYFYGLAYSGDAGSSDGQEAALVFDNAEGRGDTPDRTAVAHQMSRFWTNFAHTGLPSPDGLRPWRPYTLADRATMVIDVDSRVVVDPNPEQRRAWQKMPAR